MPTVELLKLIALFLGVPLGAMVLAVALLAYPATRLLLGDLLKLFAFTGRWVRRAAIGAEVEGSVNSFVNQYNTEANDLILPQCRVEWVSADNHAQTIVPGTVVVRVSLDRDHDRNFFSATTTFVKHAFLPRAKAFLSKATSRGVDLAMVHGILHVARRAALRIFNEEFGDESPEVKRAYFALEDIDRGGLLKPILFRELHYLGETLGDRAPRPEYSAEADEFLDWLHRLSVREMGEFSVLHFAGREMKVGVILVARDETLQHGIDPYLRRALSYATQGFESVYLLSRGPKRGDITKSIAKELEKLGGFEILAKRVDIPVGDPHSNEIITCVPLRVDPVALIQTGWARLAAAKQGGTRVRGTVLWVADDKIEVEAYGIRAVLGPESMSGLRFTDAARYFKPGDELTLDVIEVDVDTERLVLSNVGTESDPKRVVDAFASSADQVVNGVVQRFPARDGFEFGVQVTLEGTPTPGWVPRSRARCGQFVPLSGRFSLGSSVPVKVLSFDADRNSWLCEAAGIPEPWSQAGRFLPGNNYDVAVREIAERRIVCELLDGVEAIAYQDEIAWGGDDERKSAIEALEPGKTISALLLSIEPEKRFARLSLKRVNLSKTESYFKTVRDKVLSAEVIEVSDSRARAVVPGQEVGLVIPIREVVWGYCDSLAHILRVGMTIEVVPFDYRPDSDTIIASTKRAHPNDYAAIVGKLVEGQVLDAEVLAVGRDQVYTKSVIDGRVVAGYVHKSQVSNALFVTPDDIAQLLPVGTSHPVVIKRRDDRNLVLELSRRSFFQIPFDSLKYGESYRGVLHTLADGRRLFVSRDFEALAGRSRTAAGTSVPDMEVTIARRGTNPREVEVEF